MTAERERCYRLILGSGGLLCPNAAGIADTAKAAEVTRTIAIAGMVRRAARPKFIMVGALARGLGPAKVTSGPAL